MSSAAWIVSGSPAIVSVAVSNESDSAPTVMPRPSIPPRTRSTRCACTPCDVAAPTFVNGFSACDTDATPGVAASALTSLTRDVALEDLVLGGLVEDLQAARLAALPDGRQRAAVGGVDVDEHAARLVADRQHVLIEPDPALRGRRRQQAAEAVAQVARRPAARVGRAGAGSANRRSRTRLHAQREYSLSWISSHGAALRGVRACT